jgi:hypothetical protein
LRLISNPSLETFRISRQDNPLRWDETKATKGHPTPWNSFDYSNWPWAESLMT